MNLCYNSTPAERARGCVWAEKYESATHVAKNRGTVTGVVPIDFGATFNGGAGNFVSYPSGSMLNKPSNSFVVEDRGAFAANDGVSRVWISTANIAIYKDAANILRFVAGALSLQSAYAVWSLYWLQNNRNVIVATGTSGSSFLYLNGVTVGTSAGAFTYSDDATLFIGSDGAGTQNFSGRILSVKVFNNILTAQEAYDYYRGSTF